LLNFTLKNVEKSGELKICPDRKRRPFFDRKSFGKYVAGSLFPKVARRKSESEEGAPDSETEEWDFPKIALKTFRRDIKAQEVRRNLLWRLTETLEEFLNFVRGSSKAFLFGHRHYGMTKTFLFCTSKYSNGNCQRFVIAA
jgi:hypothetical protein